MSVGWNFSQPLNLFNSDMNLRSSASKVYTIPQRFASESQNEYNVQYVIMVLCCDPWDWEEGNSWGGGMGRDTTTIC